MKDRINNRIELSRISSYSSTDWIDQSPGLLKKEATPSSCSIKKRYIVILVGLAIAIGTILYFFGAKIFAGIFKLMIDYSNWMTENIILGIFIYMLIFVTLMVCLIPPSLMIGLGAFTFVRIYGHAYGLWLLALIVYVTTQTGIYLTYFIGRNGCNLGHKLAKNMKNFDVLNHLVKTRGIKITVLLRVVQVVPYPIINYIMSTTDIPHLDYFIGNHACITDAMIHTYIGLSMNICEIKDGKWVESGATESDSSTIVWKIIFALLGLIVLVTVLFFVVRIARKELDEMIKKEEKKNTPEQSDSEGDQTIVNYVD